MHDPAHSMVFDSMFTTIVVLTTDREKIQALEDEERSLKEENVRLQRKLLREMERREALSRQLSESESSLEMDDER